jgi:hypothetical protein
MLSDFLTDYQFFVLLALIKQCPIVTLWGNVIRINASVTSPSAPFANAAKIRAPRGNTLATIFNSAPFFFHFPINYLFSLPHYKK